MEIPTPRQLLRSLGPLPETSARTPPNFREVPPGAFPVTSLAGRLSELQALWGFVSQGICFLRLDCHCAARRGKPKGGRSLSFLTVWCPTCRLCFCDLVTLAVSQISPCASPLGLERCVSKSYESQFASHGSRHIGEETSGSDITVQGTTYHHGRNCYEIKSLEPLIYIVTCPQNILVYM